MLHGLATSHGFNDGNKRTAWLTTSVLYELSGYTLDLVPGDRIDDVVVDIVTGDMALDQLEDWLKARTRRT